LQKTEGYGLQRKKNNLKKKKGKIIRLPLYFAPEKIPHFTDCRKGREDRSGRGKSLSLHFSKENYTTPSRGLTEWRKGREP